MQASIEGRFRGFFAPLLAAAAALAVLVPAHAAEMAPDVLVKNVTQEVIAIVSTDKAIQAGNRAKTIALVEEKVLPHFDFERMTQIAMSANWRKATPEQKKRLTEEFKTLLVRTYASSIQHFSNQRFQYRPLRLKPTDTDVTVSVRVLQSGTEPVTIDYQMEKTPAGWKVWDVVVGGFDYAINYRTQFASTVTRSGIDGLIKELTEKNDALEKTASAKGTK